MKTDYFDDPYVQTMIENMPEKTGKTLEDWFSLLNNRSLENHSQIMSTLKGEFNLTHGYANTISLLYRQNEAGGPPTHAALIEAQYEKKSQLKPLYDRLIKEIKTFGNDIEIAPKKSYVSCRRARQFAIIQPSTKTRLDLGLNLKDVNASGALIEGDKWNGMCTHRIELHAIDEVTPEVIDWLKLAYQNAG